MGIVRCAPGRFAFNSSRTNHIATKGQAAGGSENVAFSRMPGDGALATTLLHDDDLLLDHHLRLLGGVARLIALLRIALLRIALLRWVTLRCSIGRILRWRVSTGWV